MDRKVITISRQCGSGGHTIGKMVAEQLKIPFYDKKLMEIISERGIVAGDAKEHILDRDKKRSQHYNYYTGQVWGMAENYDICLSSSFYGAEGCVRLVLDGVDVC